MFVKIFFRGFCSKSVFKPVHFNHTTDLNKFEPAKNCKKFHKQLQRTKAAAGEGSSFARITSPYNSRAESDSSGHSNISENLSTADGNAKSSIKKMSFKNSTKQYVARNKNKMLKKSSECTEKYKNLSLDKKNFLESTQSLKREKNFIPKKKNNVEELKSLSSALNNPKSISRANLDTFMGDDSHSNDIETRLMHDRELLFGIYPVLLALKSQKRKIYKVMCKEGLPDSNANVAQIKSIAESIGIEFLMLPNKSMKSLFPPGIVHQNVACIASSIPLPIFPPVEEVPSVENWSSAVNSSGMKTHDSRQIWIVLDHIVDPMNMGALLRSCAYFGASHVLITPSCAPINGLVSKASSGAVELLPVSILPEPTKSMQHLQGLGWQVVTTAAAVGEDEEAPCTAPTVSVDNFAPAKKLVLVFGNESKGVSGRLSSIADASLSIESKGILGRMIGSLNVSVAAAIILQNVSSKQIK